tara:strand:+ start:1146 stop:1391 length:246 start_codon:yes stop_codon:yes gene_type:complete
MSSKLKGDLAPKSNKTPYELRLEILHLAQHIIDRENENKLAVLHLQNEKSERFTPLDKTFQGSEDEILLVAKKLNDFVSNG